MVRRLWHTAFDRAAALALDDLPDAELLARFLADRAGPAFPVIVRRHGPLVWGVCRNLLPTEADAEDAFQATFLALANGAAGIRNSKALGTWLHAVAGRACRMAVRARARRVRRERASAVPEATVPIPEDAWDRWQAVVHAEVDRLPKALREAFVLCVLQGVRQPDAAKRLGWSLGSVSARVCQAKKRLVAAMSRRGLTGAVGAAALLGSGAAAGPVSIELFNRAAAVVAGPVPEVIHQLARGAIGGVMGNTKLLAAGLLAAGLAVGSGLIPTAGGQVPAGAPTAPRANNPADALRPGDPRPAADTPRFRASGGPPAVAPTAPAPVAKVEYKFVPTPTDPTATMDLLTKLGAEGWEYAGPLPGKGDRLVFKQVVRAGAAAWTTPAVAPTAEPMRAPSRTAPAPSPRPARPLAEPELTEGIPTLPADVADPASRNQIPRLEPTRPSDPILPATGGRDIEPPVIEAIPPTLNADRVETRPTPVLELAAGETVRHRMRTGAVIDRIKAGASKVPLIEASPDPTDAKRVLIKAGGTDGNIELFLTDANGVQEAYTIRVKATPTLGERP